ncbi:hypothetical protein NDU88_001983 [Pleurodeles waltl]|uniref:Uncharacterized protein n=1 Tax=Pleurodeles waltl TaxID=8319 RepID=A0AAV7WMH2_PLEWA|nr:hypothetical protein NDU88_001983 [Pleurodeles waltl]
MCAPQLTTSEEIWRTAGAVWWYRAALELRRTRKNVARIPLRGNSSSCNTRASGAASEKWRWAEQPKEIPEKNARKKTVRQSGEGGVCPAPLLPLTRVEGTVQLPQDNLVPAKEKGGSECSRLSDHPAPEVPVSETISQFYVGDNALPRCQGNDDTGNCLGNPDVRVPESVEREDGLCAARGKGKTRRRRRRGGGRKKRPELCREL